MPRSPALAPPAEPIDAVSWNLEEQHKAVHGITMFVQTWMSGPDVDAEATFLLLYQIGGNEILVEGFNYATGDEAEEFAEDIWSAAAQDAETRRGRSKYLVRPDGASKKVKSRFPFQVTILSRTPEGEIDFNEGVEEEANAKGIIGQSQRHTEKAYALSAQMLQLVVGQLRQDIETKDRRITRLEATIERLQSEREEVLDMQQRRAIEYDEYKRNQERKDKALEMAMGLLPIVVQFITKTATNPDDAATKFRAFSSMLSDEHKQALFVTLTTEQQQMLRDAFQATALPPGGSGPAGMLGQLMGGLNGGA